VFVESVLKITLEFKQRIKFNKVERVVDFIQDNKEDRIGGTGDRDKVSVEF
jgi:hypothetical protein